jgi:hypothetical protein
MYEGYKLCPDLKPREYCLVVQQYKQGAYSTLFHTHIPKHRISHDRRCGLMKALVARYEPLWFERIVAGYVNSRPGKPAHENHFPMHTSYPEPGVLRFYCGSNTVAWLDDVITPWEFRK